MFKKIALGFAAAALAVSVAGAQSDHSQNVVDTAVAAGSFSTLARALQSADLVDTLKGTGPFTVFAPTDASALALMLAALAAALAFQLL